MIKVGRVAEAIGRSFPKTKAAVSRLSEAGIVAPISLARQNRAFEAREVIDAFSDLERQLAGPEGNTRTSGRRGPSRSMCRRLDRRTTATDGEI